MAQVTLAQETVDKHFMPRLERYDVADPHWQDVARQNHRNRGGLAGRAASVNTLLFIKASVWPAIANMSYFGEHNPPDYGGQLALTVDKEDIDRIISTEKHDELFDPNAPTNLAPYVITADLFGDAIVDATFLCGYGVPGAGQEPVYTIVHFEGLGN